MSRAIFTLPIARDAIAEAAAAALGVTALRKIPGANNGVLQAWDTNERELLAPLYQNDPQVVYYLTYAAVPWALRRFLFEVRRSTTTFTFGTGAGATDIRWILLDKAIRQVDNDGVTPLVSYGRGRNRSTQANLVGLYSAFNPATHYLMDTRPVHVWAGEVLVAQTGGTGGLTDSLGQDA